MYKCLPKTLHYQELTKVQSHREAFNCIPELPDYLIDLVLHNKSHVCNMIDTHLYHKLLILSIIKT